MPREKVEISRAKYDGVKNLGNQRNTLGTAVSVDSKDQDSLGRQMGKVAEYSKELELRQPCFKVHSAYEQRRVS